MSKTDQEQSPSDRAYRRTLTHLYGRRGGAFCLGLERIEALLRAVGQPHLGRTQYIVVAGTNGKGSTSALIADYLRLCGLRVGLYTSPHLLRFTERIRVDGEDLATHQVVRLYDRICATTLGNPEQTGDDPPSYFECVTTMALMAFAEAAVDIAVLEVGLGGRLDATNVVPKLLSVITPVSMDHEHLLGDTLAAIAAEKGGIIDPSGPVVIAPQAEAAAIVLEDIARHHQAVVYQTPAPRQAGGRLSCGDLVVDISQIGMPAYQHINIATGWRAVQALAAVSHAAPLRREVFVQAVQNFSWPGRYQWLEPAQSPPVLLDAAHNLAGGEALHAALSADPRLRHRPLHLLVSGLRNKPTASIAALLQPLVVRTYVCPLAAAVDRGRQQDELRDILAQVHNGRAYHGVAAALASAQADAQQANGVVLVAGSVFLVAEVLGIVTPGPRDPPIAA